MVVQQQCTQFVFKKWPFRIVAGKSAVLTGLPCFSQTHQVNMRLTHPNRPWSRLSLPICLLWLSFCHIWCKIFPIVHSALSRVSYRNLFGEGCMWIFLSVFFLLFFFIFQNSDLNLTILLYTVGDEHFMSKWIFLCLFSQYLKGHKMTKLYV